MIKRLIELDFATSLEYFPVTGIIGPRQVGKTTLAKRWKDKHDIVYLDLERNSDLNKLRDPELFLTQVSDKTVILDEIQHLPELFPADPRITRQLLQMIASSNGGLPNYSAYAKSLGLSVPTITTYIGFLTNAFLTTLLPPWHVNIKKRLTKTPKIYIRDSGMLHYLLGIESFESLLGNHMAGNSWEGFVISQIASVIRSDDEMYHYRTQDGSKIDILVRRNDSWLLAAEIKLTNSPSLTKGTYIAIEDLGIAQLQVITPGSDTYPLAANIRVTNLAQILKELKES